MLFLSVGGGGDTHLAKLLLPDSFSLLLRGCALSPRVPSPSPILDENPAPMGPEIISSTGAGVWRKVLGHCTLQFCTACKYWSAMLNTCKEIVASFLNNVRIHGSLPSPGLSDATIFRW